MGPGEQEREKIPYKNYLGITRKTKEDLDREKKEREKAPYIAKEKFRSCPYAPAAKEGKDFYYG